MNISYPTNHCRLGVNIDHIATLRNARGDDHPNLIRAAKIVEKCKADSITMHLREDRRHILDKDLFEIKTKVKLPINLEIAPTFDMVEIAKKLKPESICLVPENREELTTEGGLDIVSNFEHLKKIIEKFIETKIKICCFIDADLKQIESLKNLNINCIEFHTGRYALSKNQEEKNKFLNKIKKSVDYATKLGITCHAGHGLNFNNVYEIASIKNIKELNIGQFLIGEAIFVGLETCIGKIKKKIESARK